MELTCDQTPAPSRFLISKRPGTQRGQNQTPNQQQAGGPHQFHATPRFTSTSTPRPGSTQTGPAFTTPALAIKHRVSRARPTQDIIDDSSPVSAEKDSPSASPAAVTALPEPIEFESSLVPQSSPPEQFEQGRSPKRRRISIASSEPETEPQPVVSSFQHSEDADSSSLPDAFNDHIVSHRSGVEIDDVETDGHEDHDDTAISPTQSIPSSPTARIKSEDSPWPSSPSDDEEDEGGGGREGNDPPPRRARTTPTSNAAKKPAFPRAPRFKPPDPPDHNHARPPDTYLPADIFSPQRRGARYLPGGLAAELRDWLVDVKEGVAVVDGEVDGKGRAGISSALFCASSTSSTVARVVVGEVRRGGPGMTLISGRVVAGGGGSVGEGASARVILAGLGNVEGLGRESKGCGNQGRVVPGAVVAVAPPAWDAELDGKWVVAYRWEVVEGGEERGGHELRTDGVGVRQG